MSDPERVLRLDPSIEDDGTGPNQADLAIRVQAELDGFIMTDPVLVQAWAEIARTQDIEPLTFRATIGDLTYVIQYSVTNEPDYEKPHRDITFSEPVDLNKFNRAPGISPVIGEFILEFGIRDADNASGKVRGSFDRARKITEDLEQYGLSDIALIHPNPQFPPIGVTTR